MKYLFLFVVFFDLLFAALFGFAVNELWGWFVVTRFGVAPIGAVYAIGTSILVCFVYRFFNILKHTIHFLLGVL